MLRNGFDPPTPAVWQIAWVGGGFELDRGDLHRPAVSASPPVPLSISYTDNLTILSSTEIFVTDKFNHLTACVYTTDIDLQLKYSNGWGGTLLCQHDLPLSPWSRSPRSWSRWSQTLLYSSRWTRTESEKIKHAKKAHSTIDCWWKWVYFWQLAQPWERCWPK